MSALSLPNMSRIWLIAMRDFMGYVKTWGFWLSFLLPIVFGFLGYFFASSDFDFSPPKYETILDSTGFHGDAIRAFYEAEQEEIKSSAVSAMAQALPQDERDAFRELVNEQGAEAGLEELKTRFPTIAERIELPTSGIILVEPPASNREDLMPYLSGSESVVVDGAARSLNGVIIFSGTRERPEVQYWSRNFNNAPAERLINRYLREQAQIAFLAEGDLRLEDYNAAMRERERVDVFDPMARTAEGEEAQAVTLWDRLPFLAGIGLAFFLLMTIFAGAFMLLTSMIEEKMNKLLEMMLATTRFSEIMLGKMLGAALLTIASLAPYILIALGGIFGFLLFGEPEQVAAVREAFPLSTILISFIFLILGYMFYAAILIALGALAQSMQDAQTLSLPIVLLMFLGMGVIMIGLNSPDSPLVTAGSIFPLTSPFAMMVRLSSDPPLWQIILSLALLLASVVGVMWLCARIFRFGVLSGSGVEVVKSWFNRVVLRKAA